MTGVQTCAPPISEFSAKKQKDAEEFVIQGLESWCYKMGIDKMILCGHSLGGYIAVKYAYKYPQQIISLVLLSPAGVWSKPPNFESVIEEKFSDLGFVQKALVRNLMDYWVPGKSPIQLLRKFGRPAILALKTYSEFYPGLQKEERDDFKEYLFQILMKPGTGELALGYLLDIVVYNKIIGCLWNRSSREISK